MNIPRMLTATATALVLLLAGCSGDTPPGPGGGGGGGNGGGGTVDSTPDPCTLVTKDEASAAVGAAVSDGVSEGVSEPKMPAGRSCRYAAVSGRGQLTITIWSGDSALFQTHKGQAQGEVKDVAGVGDQAFRNGWTGLSFLTGGYILSMGIEMLKYDPDDAQTSLKTLATASIARL